MEPSTIKPVSSKDKVMQYLNGSMSICDRSKPSTNELFSRRCLTSLDCDSLSSSSSSMVDSPSHSDSSLSDPVACSGSSNQSLDEDLDFNIGFEQIDEQRPICYRTNSDATIIVDQYFRQSSKTTTVNEHLDVEYHFKRTSLEFPHDSTYTLCSPNPFTDYTEDELSTSLSIRSNSFSTLPNDDHPTFADIKAPKKVVHFADTLGLDLESIRYMTPPDQPANSFIQECFRLQLGQIHSVRNPFDIPNIYKRISHPLMKQYNLVSKNFTSPINITPVIYEQQILLECLYTKNACAYGTIRVHNCAYDKHVFIRLTYDEWQTSNDLPASHSMNYSHDRTDTFIFEINLTEEQRHCKRILFAVCLQINGQEYWDNNQGWNYVLDVFERR